MAVVFFPLRSVIRREGRIWYIGRLRSKHTIRISNDTIFTFNLYSTDINDTAGYIFRVLCKSIWFYVDVLKWEIRFMYSSRKMPYISIFFNRRIFNKCFRVEHNRAS